MAHQRQQRPYGLFSYPPTINEAEKKRLVEAIEDWSVANGFAVRPPPALLPSLDTDPHGVLTTTVPVTLFPSPFPAECFQQARRVQTEYNELYASISQDEAFLEGVVKEIVEVDEFIANLWDVHVKVKEEGYAQSLSLGLFRSDFMVHQDKRGDETALQIKQVEFNTIAASFGGLSTKTSALHRFLAATEYPLLKSQAGLSEFQSRLPPNNSAAGLAAGLKAAHVAYRPSRADLQTCILFIVQDGERNMFDQRHLEYALYQLTGPDVDKDSAKHLIRVFRLSFSQILEHTTVDKASPQRPLLYHLPGCPDHRTFEVSVAYLRAGYGPGDYLTPQAWKARHHLERSGAVKCPTVLTQLAGMKKVQQVLAVRSSPSSPNPHLHLFPRDPSALVATFANILPMDAVSPAGQKARSLALDPESCRYHVLKPQREGGGNNHYRSAIPSFLRSVPERTWGSYILMEMIEPPPVSNAILRNGQLEAGGVICELGVYGVCLWRQHSKEGGGAEMLVNEEVGYLLRTKGDQSDEGGVAAGFGCMDSCYLV